MNSSQINTFKEHLANVGLKNFESVVKNSISLHYDRYLELAEPLYVISRMYQFADINGCKDKLLEANIAWDKIVIDNDWCTPLNPYVKEYGKELVWKAVVDLEKHNLWKTPRGNAMLRSSSLAIYDGLSYITETIEDIMEAEDIKKPVKVEYKASEFKQKPIDKVLDMDLPHCAGYASAMSRDLEDCLGMASDALSKIKEYLVFAEERETADSSTEIRDLIDKNKELAHNVSDLTSELETSQRQYKQMRNEFNAKSQEVVNLENKLNNVKTELQRTQNVLSETRKELAKSEELRRKVDVLPRKRIIPKSRITGSYGVGPKLFSLMKEVFEKEKLDIYIDEKR